MSNRSLKCQIEKALARFRAGEIDLKTLISSVESNGRALEMMPYSLVTEIGQIEYQLTISQFSDEEGCELNIDDALGALEAWIEKIPLDVPS